MAGFCWTSCRERNPAGAGSLYERIKRDDTKSIHAPKGFRDAPTHRIESSCRFSTFLFHPLFVYVLHNYSVGISCRRHFLAQSRAFCRSYVVYNIYHVHPDRVPKATKSQGVNRIASFISIWNAGFSDTPPVFQDIRANVRAIWTTMPSTFEGTFSCFNIEAPPQRNLSIRIIHLLTKKARNLPL